MRLIRIVPLAGILASAACYGTGGSPSDLDRVAAPVVASLEAGESPAVIVLFDRRTGPALERIPSGDWKTTRTFATLPVAAVRLESFVGLQAFLDDPSVERVLEDERLQIEAADDLELIGQPVAAAAGMDGSGRTVAVIDTGVDYRHEDLGACTSAGAAGCPVVFAADFAPEDGQLDENGHGTNVAAIVRRVAPDVRIAALDVARGRDAHTSDIAAAIDWTIAHRVEHDIVALNLSIGGGIYAETCDRSVLAIALDIARSDGIAPVVSSGNDGDPNGVGSPACAPAAISVGAVYSASIGGVGYPSCEDASSAPDQIACFSNASSFLTLLAPGVAVRAGGRTMTGTSQAAPHVAGAVAVLAEAYPREDVESWVGRLRQSGRPIFDARSSRTYPRLDLAAALEPALSPPPPPPSPPPPPEEEPPVAPPIDLPPIEASPVSPPDTNAPTDGELWGWRDHARVDLEWLGFSDLGFGIESFRLVVRTDRVPESCDEGKLLYQGSSTTFTHLGLVDGRKHYYRVCATDRSGNRSAGAITAVIPGEPIVSSGPDGERVRFPG